MSELLTDFIKNLYNNIFSSIHESSALSSKIIFSIIILILAFWLSNLSKRKIWKKFNDLKVYLILKKSILTAIRVITFILLLATWIHAKNSLIVILLIALAILAFSVKSLSMELVGWMLLLNRKLFTLYDRIEIGDHTGDVIKITPLYFKMIERGESFSTNSPTGKVISIPNHVLLEEPLVNFNKFTEVNWKEIKFPIVIDSDWQSAKNICEEELQQYINTFKSQFTTETLQEIEEKISLFDGKIESKVNVFIEDSLVYIICYFPVKYKDGSKTKTYLTTHILSRLNQHPSIELSGEKIHVNINNAP